MIYFISDTHFNHDNIIKYCNRPFNNSSDMNEVIINNYNSVINEDDTVYHLGDFAFGSKEELIRLRSILKGNVYLIRGNHDMKGAMFYENVGFKVLVNAPIKLDEYKLILSHRPLSDKEIPQGYINVHGHIHNNLLNDEYPSSEYSKNKHFNVSVDANDFKPVSLERVKLGM